MTSASSASSRRLIGRRPLHEEIQDLLIGLSLQPGDPVPSEAELIEMLGVSRGTLREALKQLQALGIIETRHGTGMFIADFTLSPLVNGLVFHAQIASPDRLLTQVSELAEVREMLECQLVRRVADEIDGAGLDHLRTQLRSMSADPQDSLQLDDADLAFHAALYRDLGNSLVMDLLYAFWRTLRLLRPRLDDFGDREAVLAKHEDIVEAVAARDPEAAEAAMRVHFSGTRAWLQSAAPTSA